MKKQKKVPTSEAALRRAIKALGYDPEIAILKTGIGAEVFIGSWLECRHDKYLWRGRLSDIYRKRAPIRGAKKAMNKLLRGKK